MSWKSQGLSYKAREPVGVCGTVGDHWLVDWSAWMIWGVCYEATALLLRGLGFGVWGSVWNSADVKQGEGFWMLASVHALHLPSVVVQIF